MKVDLHVHTKYSGHSLLGVEKVARIAKERNLDAVAITDHNEVKGAIELSKIFPTIVGEEISCNEGDVIGLFLSEKIGRGQALEVMDKIRAQGGLVVIPHPFDELRRGIADEDVCAKADMIEVFNSRVTRARDNIKAVAFSNLKGIPAVVGSDAHTSLEIGRSWMEIGAFNDPKSFMRALATAEIHTRKSPFYVHVQTKLLKLGEVFH